MTIQQHGCVLFSDPAGHRQAHGRDQEGMLHGEHPRREAGRVVTGELDGGPVVAQAKVPVLANDDPASLSARVLAVEHPLLVMAVGLAVAGRIAEQDATVLLDGHPLFTPLQLGSTT